ncbi:hypothetical protein BDZ91DRAFT_665136 [Kalaharituber pfeilii]|nr:hypothetical protein BDZ91DRAFT_665136 [Kalaharituber pfeilii]
MSRDGKVVDGDMLLSLRHQRFVSLIGIAFAFTIKALYACAIESAYQQVVWRVWKKNHFTVKGIDSAISLPVDLRAFVSLELWKKARRSICIGMIIWYGYIGPLTILRHES